MLKSYPVGCAIGFNAPMGSRALMWSAAGCASIGFALALCVDKSLALFLVAQPLLLAAVCLGALALVVKGKEPGGLPNGQNEWVWFVMGTDAPADPGNRYQGLVFVRSFGVWFLAVFTPIWISICWVFGTPIVYFAAALYGLQLFNLAWIQLKISRLPPG